MEKEILISLNTVEKVKNFVNKVSKYDSDEITLDLISGRYIIDAKSIMGIFSLDLSKNLTLRMLAKDENLINNLKEDIKNYIINWIYNHTYNTRYWKR